MAGVCSCGEIIQCPECDNVVVNETEKLIDLLEDAWIIIANAGGGNWDKEELVWKHAAEKWRTRWHHVLESNLYSFDEEENMGDSI